MDKILRFFKGFAILVSCLFLGIALLVNEHSAGERISYALVGCFILAFVYVPSFRNLLFSAFFFLLSIAGMALVFEDGSFVWSGALLEVAFVCIFIYFSRKVFGNIRLRKRQHIDMYDIDNMTGLEFEHFTADLLSRLGYYRISVTKASGDQGIDVIAHKDGLSYAIQCKHYSGNLGNSAVQEAYAGKTHYGCFYAVVFTNSYFTEGARELASSTGVLLWDRSVLQEMLLQAGVPHSSLPSSGMHEIPDVDAPDKIVDSTPRDTCSHMSVAAPLDSHISVPISSTKPSNKSSQEASVDDDFIAEAQWYASRGGVDLSDDD